MRGTGKRQKTIFRIVYVCSHCVNMYILYICGCVYMDTPVYLLLYIDVYIVYMTLNMYTPCVYVGVCIYIYCVYIFVYI